MKNTFLFVLMIASSWQIFGQESSDPATKVILEAMKTKVESYENMVVDFSLTIAFPEEDPEEQKGKLMLSGDQYNLDLGSQTIISDGKTLWFYLKARNEVQINDYVEDEEGDIMSPKELFKIYEKDDYIYALVFEGMEKGRAVQKIEFKPTDPESEYSKMRMTLDKGKKELMRVKAFGKDGSRYTLNLDSFKANADLSASTFQFDASDYPDVQIEDLRN